MLTLFAACVLTVCPTYTVTVAGDSVVLTVAIADDLGSQPVSVDSLLVRADIGAFGSELVARVAKVAGEVTVARLAWDKAHWAPNQTRGSAIRVTAGHVGDCAGGVCWGPETEGPAWSYFRDATAPVAIPAEAITVQSVGLN